MSSCCQGPLVKPGLGAWGLWLVCHSPWSSSSALHLLPTAQKVLWDGWGEMCPCITSLLRVPTGQQGGRVLQPCGSFSSPLRHSCFLLVAALAACRERTELLLLAEMD